MNPFRTPPPFQAPPHIQQQWPQLAQWFDQGVQLMANGQSDPAFEFFAGCFNALGNATPDSVLIRLGLCRLHRATIACIASLRSLTAASRPHDLSQGGLRIAGMAISTAGMEQDLKNLSESEKARKVMQGAIQEAVYYFQLVQQRYPYAYPEVQEFIAETQGLQQIYDTHANQVVAAEQVRAQSMARAARWAEAYAYGEIARARQQIEFNKRLAEHSRDHANARYHELMGMAQGKFAVGDYEGAAQAASWAAQYGLDAAQQQQLADSAERALRGMSHG